MLTCKGGNDHILSFYVLEKYNTFFRVYVLFIVKLLRCLESEENHKSYSHCSYPRRQRVRPVNEAYDI